MMYGFCKSDVFSDRLVHSLFMLLITIFAKYLKLLQRALPYLFLSVIAKFVVTMEARRGLLTPRAVPV